MEAATFRLAKKTYTRTETCASGNIALVTLPDF
jgi:hypothetical protein